MPLLPKCTPPSRLSLRQHIQDTFWRSNSVTLQSSRGTSQLPIIYVQRACQRRQHRHYCHHNDEHCGIDNRKYHHGDHPLIGCKHNHPTQRQPDCANEPDGGDAVHQPTPLQSYNTNHQSNNSPFQCSNLLSGPHRAVSTMEMEEVAGGGAADKGAVDVGTGVINAHHMQTLDATKVSETSAEATVVGEFHRPQERLIHRRQLLCHLMHGTLPCLS
jgi:hypothetical protein